MGPLCDLRLGQNASLTFNNNNNSLCKKNINWHMAQDIGCTGISKIIGNDLLYGEIQAE